MGQREYVQRPRPTNRKLDDVLDEIKVEEPTALKGDLDDVLNEIDEVLEQNAEEFVANYVQKGGE